MNSKVTLIKPRRFGDERGWFTEVYSELVFGSYGIDCRFVQDNHSLSVPTGTIRGLHFQTPPCGQAKLVRCVRGSIFDVAVDVRHNSPTYGQSIGVELSASNGHQLFVPVGFAHGFMTLEANTEVTYKVSSPYAPQTDGGIRWSDPDIGVEWPLAAGCEATVSPKDERLPFLSEFLSPFEYRDHGNQPLELVEMLI